jgi:hypothetical protein
MSAKGKVAAAGIGVCVPLAAIGVDIAFFNSNPLTMVAAITAVMAGGLYLLTYQEHE